LQVSVLAVGRLRPCFREACDEYLRRLRRVAEVREVEVREAARAGSPALQRREEAKRLTVALPDRVVRVALDLRGEPWSSEELARRVGAWRDAARPVALVIGGAEGLDPAVLEASDLRWSLGPMTLPHELARVVVMEQLYRAFAILRGAPYHKGDSRGS
jgi:23S rRNA (pseudouridine1915-N3)-methyltransferase